ncbi:hypothetical protein [Salibacter halophilus]|uniref:SIR2-like domain-containing protein n=1 Tax=Salibacter halophilus TaxID=1803916 RepID=A0A6N6M5D0_9FLAO|nr:hypothetical protein [Salibacter halophilus]KAB1064723.1 hypothetical protein F3059_05045 [Salibacter halophilus]
MIQEKTVFVLGAGASKPFGFPLGSELVDLIYSSLEYKPLLKKELIGSSLMKGAPYKETPVEDDSKSANPLFQMLLDLGHTKNEILSFRNDLVVSQLNSVDAFLEHRVEYIPIGKAAIAYNLLQFESSQYLYDNPDWYKYLRNIMNSTYDSFADNQISFITFNYDRSLEYYLINSLRATYGKSIVESYELLKTTPIIHLHGKLGPLPWETQDMDIPFGYQPKNHGELKYVADSIKIIHEDIDSDKEFTSAKKLLSKANKIYILGFGFSPTNILRLGLNELDTESICSAYKLTKLEINLIRRSNPKMKPTLFPAYDCLDFLRNEVPLK